MARSRQIARTARLQQGWVGLIGLLLALLIVAWLGRSLLLQLLPPPPTMSRGSSAINRVPGGAAPAEVDATTASPSPRNELERAKGLESATRDQASEISKRIDDQAK
ncbi:MAG: hypothetical protein ABI552_13500 [Casimicrobiaceae bacterium]